MPLAPLARTLLARIAHGGLCSGAELAAELGVTRTAVWKHIKTLSDLGLDIRRVPGQGYHLTEPVELLDATRIYAGLSPPARAVLHELEIHDVLDSTSSHLQRQMPAPDGQSRACFAEQQTAGRGRMGRNWVSPFGRSLALSVTWRFVEGHAAAAGLSLAAGVAVTRALQRAGLEGIQLKWPNDLLWNRRKLGGILVEVSGESHGPCRVVLGIGLNLALSGTQGAHIDQPWVDCREIAAGSVDRNHLASALLDEVLTLLCTYARDGLATHLPAWRAANGLIGQPVTLHLGDLRIAGVAEDITPDGALCLRLANGERRAFAAGEVRVRLDGAP